MPGLDRRFFVIGATAAIVQQPALASTKGWRWLGAGIEAVLVGAVSGYVAARIAQGQPTRVIVDSNWHRGDRLTAGSDFDAIEYPTEALLSVPAGNYEVKSSKVVRAGTNTIKVLTVKNHHIERYVGVAYAV